MGALTSNRKRVDECFSSYSPSLPSPSINSPNYCRYSHKIDSGVVLKKARVCESDQVVEKAALRSCVSGGGLSYSAVDRLRKYPEPAGKLRREVHAPSRVKRFASVSGFRAVVSESPKKEEEAMGNSITRLVESLRNAKRNALGSFRHVRVVEDEEERRRGEVVVIDDDRDDMVIIEDGNEVRSGFSDEGKAVGSKGLGLVLESRDLDKKGSDGSWVTDGSVVHSVEAYKKLLTDVDKSYSGLSTLNFEIESTEAKWRSQRLVRCLKKEQEEKKKLEEEKKREELKKPEEDLLREPFLLLTDEEESEVNHALFNSNRRKVLATHENSNIEITVELLQCLRPGAWLNDEVINVYMELLKERERRDPKKFLNCHFFNTFFYKKLIGGKGGYDYKAVRRWTTLKKLGYKLADCEKIFIPIHREVHWCLAVINKKDKSFQYLDSLGGRDLRVLRVLSNYYADEVRDKCGEDIDVSSWKLEFVEDLPEQENGYDCGVFMIKYADFYSRGLGLQFSQGDMPYFRKRTAKEILRLKAD